MGVTVQSFATLHDLDNLGPVEALAPIPNARKRAVLAFASAHFASYLRRRYALPLKPWLEGLDVSAMSAGATVSQVGTPSLVAHVTVDFPAGGTVGVVGITHRISYDGGATWSATTALPLSGAILLDGVTTTLGGTIATNNRLAYRTSVDDALRGHVCAVTAYKLLHNRGLDPSVEQELRQHYDEAIAWGKDIRTGLALLDPAHDATPTLSEEGPLGTGQTSAYDFLDEVLVS